MDLLDRGEDRWRLDVTVGVLLSTADGRPLDDVAAAVDLASRQFAASDVGVRMSVIQETVGGDAAAAFERLVKGGADAVVAAVQPDEARALAQRAAQLKTPLLLVTPSEGSIQPSHLLQIAVDPAAPAAALARLVTREGPERVVVIHVRDPFEARDAAAFESAFNGTVTRTLTFRAGNAAEAGATAQAACLFATAQGLVILTQPDDAGRIVRAVDERCPGQFRIFAGPQARQQELVDMAERDGANRPRAADVLGVEALGGRPAVFNALFDAEYSRASGPFGAEAYDAATYVTLAAFAAKGGVRVKPQHADITATEILAKVVLVAGPPGVKHTELRRGAEAVKAGEDIDWAGMAHDFAWRPDRRPHADAFVTWSVTPTGAIQTHSDDRI